MRGPFITSPILKIVLGIVSVLVALVLVVLVLLTEEARMEAQTANWAGRQIENGAAIYANNCASCHNIDGSGIPGRAPALNSHYFFTERLNDVGWAGSLEDYIQLTVAAGRPSKTNAQWNEIMPTWGVEFGGPLRADQVEAVTAYVLNWEESALAQTAEEDPFIPFEDVEKPVELQRIDLTEEEIAAFEAAEAEAAAEAGPRDPSELFQIMACAGCHNLAEEQTAENRGPIGPNFGNLASNAATRVEGMSAEEYIHNSIVNPNGYIVDGYTGGIMPPNFAEQMSEEEIQSLVAWLLEQSE